MIKSIEQELQKAVDDQIFPNAELIVSQDNKIEVHTKVGQGSQTYFDLASLTKPLCTALCIAKLHEQNKLNIEQTVDEFLPTKTLQRIPLTQLLNHTSGLRDWYPFYKKRVNETKPDTQKNKTEIIEMILNDNSLQTGEPKTVYSDLGYIILGQIIELVTKQSLDQAFQDLIATPLELKDTFFNPLDFPKSADPILFYPSEESESRKRTLQGEVMDDNCFAMGGVCGHAGLFGTATDIHKILLELKQAQLGQSAFLKNETFKTFCLPDENRKSRQFYFTLGFDTPTQGLSQSGSQMSPQTIGHLGFSGTSFWWDLQKNTWIILLTNRCYPDRKNFKISDFRPQFHDFILKTLSQ